MVSLVVPVISDLLTVAGYATATLNSCLSTIIESRNEEARNILISEIRLGNASAESSELDNCVAIMYRYLRASQEGVARLNLRLLAAIFSGQMQDKAIVPNEFLHYANIIESLQYNEIILLGTFLKHSTNVDGTVRTDDMPLEKTRDELIPKIFEDPYELDATFGALLRTGLISIYAQGGGYGGGIATTRYRVTRKLLRINQLASIEGILERDGSYNQDLPHK